jgi:ribosomal protein S18 acetylase RimI-like enzyme
MNIEIAKIDHLSEKEINHFHKIINRCNKEDKTDYPFDTDDDYKKPGNINHFILYGDGKPISAVYLFTPTNHEAEFYGFTLPEYRRRGYMNTLLKEIRKEMHRRSIPSLLYVCDGASDSGRSFLKNLRAQYEYSEYAMVWENRNLKLRAPEVTLAPVTNQMKDRLIEINSSAFSESKEDAATFIDQFISSDLRDFYGILIKGELIGMIGRYLEESRDYIHGFCIDKQFRGRGYGRQALLQMVDLCQKSNPGRQIALEVETENENALGLYKSCGFKLVSTFGYYRINY